MRGAVHADTQPCRVSIPPAVSQETTLLSWKVGEEGRSHVAYKSWCLRASALRMGICTHKRDYIHKNICKNSGKFIIHMDSTMKIS